MTIRIIILVAATLIFAVTALSVMHSYRWWIRMWDFPRLAIAVLAVAVLVAAVIWLSGSMRLVTIIAMAAVIGWQGWRILPYSPLVGKEVALAAPDPDNCIKMLSFNVLQTNREYHRTLAVIEREDPDIILLLETDQKWQDALAPIIENYPHRSMAPLDNLYGLIMLSRLETKDAKIEYLIEDDTPSIFARMTTRGGREFLYMGLHPRPPQPGNDTEQRDAEIAVGAKIAAKSALPVLATGDFNDVAWSRTSQLFKRLGGYLDPRIGRGTYATFPAWMPLLRWPLDHLFISPDFTVADLKVLENVGSDHRPVIASVCLAPREAKALNDEPEAAGHEDKKVADEAIKDGLEKEATEGHPED